MTYDGVSYLSLRDRRVLVTGGSSGIGQELVRAYAAQGARVAFVDIDVPGGESTAEQTGARFYHCDLTDIAQLRRTVAAVEAEFGEIDVLLNNAGKDDRDEMASVEPEDWRRALSFNLDHQFFAAQAVSNGMKRRGSGSIVMFGSVSWMRGRPGMVGYTTAKAAINGLTRTLARELGAFGIRVNCIVPGAIATERQRRLWAAPEQERQFIELQALKIRLDGSHVARLALFLGSDESAGSTGANFVVDAGLTQN